MLLVIYLLIGYGIALWAARHTLGSERVALRQQLLNDRIGLVYAFAFVILNWGPLLLIHLADRSFPGLERKAFRL